MNPTTKLHIERYSLNWFKRQTLNVLKQGPLPQHIGFIMDGNRRYAKKMKMQSIHGHLMGFEKVLETIYWWKHLEITYITVYMFSIENFKRSQEEVTMLLQMAVTKFKEMLDNIDEFNEHEICIKIIGNFALIPEDLRQLMCELYLKTKHNKRFVLNVAFAYTSRDEITNTMKVISSAKENDEISIQEVDIDLFNNLLYTTGTPKLDMLIRTSGEVRFSDFMLWQASNTQNFFVKALWPELTFWHFIYCILQYQIHVKEFDKVQEIIQSSESNEKSVRVEEFIERHKMDQLNEVKSYCLN